MTDANEQPQKDRVTLSSGFGQAVFHLHSWPNRVYSILVELAGASNKSDDFTGFAVAMQDGCEEYRFQGRLGFGGKFRPKTMKVDCYPEDITPERLAIIERTNAALKGCAK